MNTNTKNIIAWIATVLLALLFLGTGGMKLMGGESIVKQFAAWGYPSWLRSAIGGLEIAGAIGLFVPKLRSLAIYGLIGIMVGAIYTHVVKEGLPQDSITAVGAILLGVVVLQMRKFDPIL